MMKSRMMIWARHVARMVEIRNAYRFLVVILKAKRPLWGPRPSYENKIKIDVNEIVCGIADWIDLIQGKV